MKRSSVSPHLVRVGLLAGGCMWVVFQMLGGRSLAADAVGNPAVVEAQTRLNSTDSALTPPDFQAVNGAKTLLPRERIALIDQWRKAHPAPLQHPVQQRRPVTDPAPAMPSRADVFARQMADAQSDDERALVDLKQQFAEAIDKMRSYHLAPARRIGMVDRFRQANQEAFQELRNLRKAVAEQRAAEHPALQVAPGPLPSRTPAEAEFFGQLEQIDKELAVRRAQIDQLPPRERIAAMDRDKNLFGRRIQAFRDFTKQTARSPKVKD